MKTIINDSIQDLETALKNNDELQQRFKINPIEAIRNVETTNPKDTDSWIYRIIMIIIGLVVLALTGNHDKDSQLVTIFATISSGAIGALAGLLSPSPKK